MEKAVNVRPEKDLASFRKGVVGDPHLQATFDATS